MASYAENVSIWWRHHVVEPNTFGYTLAFKESLTCLLCEIVWTVRLFIYRSTVKKNLNKTWLVKICVRYDILISSVKNWITKYECVIHDHDKYGALTVPLGAFISYCDWKHSNRPWTKYFPNICQFDLTSYQKGRWLVVHMSLVTENHPHQYIGITVSGSIWETSLSCSITDPANIISTTERQYRY